MKTFRFLKHVTGSTGVTYAEDGLCFDLDLLRGVTVVRNTLQCRFLKNTNAAAGVDTIYLAVEDGKISQALESLAVAVNKRSNHYKDFTVTQIDGVLGIAFESRGTALAYSAAGSTLAASGDLVLAYTNFINDADLEDDLEVTCTVVDSAGTSVTFTGAAAVLDVAADGTATLTLDSDASGFAAGAATVTLSIRDAVQGYTAAPFTHSATLT